MVLSVIYPYSTEEDLEYTLAQNLLERNDETKISSQTISRALSVNYYNTLLPLTLLSLNHMHPGRNTTGRNTAVFAGRNTAVTKRKAK